MDRTRSFVSSSLNLTVVPFLLLLGLGIGYLVASGAGTTVGMAIIAVCALPMVFTRGLSLLVTALPVAVVFWIPLFHVGTYNVSALFVVTAGLAFIVVLRTAANKTSSVRRELFLVPIAFLPLVFGMIGSTLTIGSFHNLLNGVLIYTVRFAFYAVLPAALVMAPYRSIRRMAFFLALSLLVGLGYSIVTPSSTQMAVANFGDRATGVFYNPNVMGDVAVLAMNWALGRAFDWHQERSSRWFSVVLTVVATISILKSGSRSALVAALASIALWGAITFWSRKTKLRAQTWVEALIALCVLGILGLLMLPRTTIWARLQEVFALGAATPNVAGRIEAFRIGLEVFAAHPLGIGVGNIPVVARPYSQSLWDIGGLTTTDNQFLEVLIESGVPGLLSFVITLIILARRARATGTPQGYSVMVNIVAMSIAGLAAFTFYSPFISSLLWTMYGMVANDTYWANVAQARATRPALIAEASTR